MCINPHILKIFIINQRLLQQYNFKIVEKKMSKIMQTVIIYKLVRNNVKVNRINWIFQMKVRKILFRTSQNLRLQGQDQDCKPYKQRVILRELVTQKDLKKDLKYIILRKGILIFKNFNFNICQLIFQKKSIYKQNPCRNILTNIGNQLITYLCTSKKSRKILLKMMNQKSQRQVRKFYEYTNAVKRDTQYYLNINKLTQFWNDFETEEERKIKINIRKLSKYYLRWVLPKSILTSKKMCPSSRLNHLKTRRTLLRYLSGKK